MKAPVFSLALALVLCVAAQGDELLTNGDFEQPLEVGWESVINGSGANVIRATHYDPDPDYEACASKGTGNGYAMASQTVPIPGLDAEFSASAKMLATATSNAWAAAALVLAYLDEDDMVLGETRICTRTTYCTWQETPTLHLIDASPSVRTEYAVQIRDELTNLPGIDPFDVRQLRVSLYAFTYDC